MIPLPLVALLAVMVSSSQVAPDNVQDWSAPRLEVSLLRGELLLRGHVATADAEAYLAERAGSAALRRHIMLPYWWTRAAEALVADVEDLHSARATLTRDSLSIRGFSADETSSDTLSGITAVLPEGVTVELDVRPLAPASDACSALLPGLVEGRFGFRPGEKVFSNEDMPRLKRLADALIRCPGYSVDVSGHTDSRGDPEDNQFVSEQRAASVRDFLVSQGVSESRVSAEGRASSEPAASNNTEGGRRANRRVEIELYSPGP